jgi:hypothetical protein
VYIYTYTHIHTYIVERRQNCHLSGRTTEDGRGKKMLENEIYWNSWSIYEYNTMYCTASCWMLGEHDDREWVSNGGINLIKAWYI